ncbi:MAG: sulfurtransferase TusA family protein [Pseudomonadota bacterium]
MSDFTKELDASGLNCPMPILRAKKALKDLQPGEILRVISTDPGSVKDFEAFAKQTGNELLESNEDGDSFVYRLKKS